MWAVDNFVLFNALKYLFFRTWVEFVIIFRKVCRSSRDQSIVNIDKATPTTMAANLLQETR
jgi:hypothetical protein